MKNLIIIFSLFLFCFTAPEARAEIDPKVKALGLMAGYGTIGGALLGTASLAFGTGGRSIAVGASLGLYAGLIFGSYVVITHKLRNRKSSSPVEGEGYDEESYESDIPSGYQEDENRMNGSSSFDQDYRWDGGLNSYSLEIHPTLHLSPSRKSRPTFYMNLIQLQF